MRTAAVVLLFGLMLAFAASATTITTVDPDSSLLGTLTPESDWSGTRSVGSGVIGSGGWAEYFNIGYAATRNPDGTYHYEYELEFTNKAISNFTIGVSPGCVDDPGCITNSSVGAPDIRWYDAYAPPLLYLPAGFYGAKFNISGEGSVSIAFDSTHAPAYQPFYAKDGTGTSAYSTFFANTSSVLPSDYIVGPDTRTSVPEPGTSYTSIAGVLIFGAAGILRSLDRSRQRE